MVSLVRLSSANIDEFQKLCEKNFNKETYDKDFFEYYNSQNFFPKMFIKRFVKLFLYKGKFIGYIWYEMPIDIYVKVFSLYIEEKYIDTVNKNTFNKFNEKYLVYESIENSDNNKLLQNLGFKITKPTIMMKLQTSYYDRKYDIKKIYKSAINNKKLLYLVNNYFNEYNKVVNITFTKVNPKTEILLRCEVQNDIFENNNRVPIEIEDIENDIKQDYYIDDLAIFMRINNSVVAYGQIIYIRKKYTVVNFGVVNGLRGFGLGKLLLDHLINKAINKGIDEVVLRVDNKNLNAISLYEWIGFKSTYNIVRWER